MRGIDLGKKSFAGAGPVQNVPPPIARINRRLHQVSRAQARQHTAQRRAADLRSQGLLFQAGAGDDPAQYEDFQRGEVIGAVLFAAGALINHVRLFEAGRAIRIV